MTEFAGFYLESTCTHINMQGLHLPALYKAAGVIRLLVNHLHLFITLKLKPENNIQHP